MTTYEYITIFTSIILGLAIVNLLGGVSLIIHKEVKTKLFPLHLLWMGNLFLLIVLLWWNNLILNNLEELSFLHYVNLVAYSVFIYMMSSLLVPIRHSLEVNFKEVFFNNYRNFYVMSMLFVLNDFADAWLEKIATNGEWRIPQMVNISTYFVLFSVGLFVRNKTFHYVVGGVFSVGLLIWLYLTLFVGFA